ncbi:MAG: class I SAM-dependent methyltransferase [Micrococcus sp.]|nr:class I SAM-dependent methyltransferase [Micrococcus sp.]
METGTRTPWATVEAERDAAVRTLRGRVLELGAGDGANFGLLHPSVDWVGLEPDRRRRARLAEKARSHGHRAAPLDGGAEDIPLPEASVDAVLGTTVLCSVADPERVLEEVARVLRPGGRALFAEHVAAPAGTATGTVLRLARPFTRVFDHGCDPTRDTEATVRASALEVAGVARYAVPVLGLVIPYVLIDARRPA